MMKQIFESSKDKKSIKERKKFVENIVELIKSTKIWSNTKFQRTLRAFQSYLSDYDLKIYFNSEKKSNSFRLFKFFRDSIDLYFEAENSDENNAQKIYDKILKSKTNLNLDKSFKISSIDKDEAKIIFSFIKTIHKKSISLLSSKFSQNISSDVRKIHRNLLNCENEIRKILNKYFESRNKIIKIYLVDISDIQKLKDYYEKIITIIKQNKKYFLNSQETIKNIQNLVLCLKMQKKFWEKFPDFSYEEYCEWYKEKNKGDLYSFPKDNDVYLYVAPGDLKRYLELINYNKYTINGKQVYHFKNVRDWNYFYGRHEVLCRVILLQRLALRLIKSLCNELNKPIKNRKRFSKIMDEYSAEFYLYMEGYIEKFTNHSQNFITSTDILKYSNMKIIIPDINSQGMIDALELSKSTINGEILCCVNKEFYEKAAKAISHIKKCYNQKICQNPTFVDAKKVGKAKTLDNADIKT